MQDMWISEKGDKIKIKVVPGDKEFIVSIPIKPDGRVKLFSKQEKKDKFIVRLECSGKQLFKFTSNKHPGDIGKSSRDKTLYEPLKEELLSHGITPDLGKSDQKQNIQALVSYLTVRKVDFDEAVNSDEWNSQEDEEKPELKCWFEPEEFDDSIVLRATRLLEKEMLIDAILEVADLKVVKQRGKIGLVTLIAMSTFMEKSLHAVAMGPPGIGKTAITDVIFEMFPNHRKVMIGKTSTQASLMNMTKYKEGSEVLKFAFTRLGDLGSKEELKDPDIKKNLGVFRELMSEGKYCKNLSDMQDDESKTVKLELDGIGSIHLSTVADKIEEQYDSRAILLTPEKNAEVDQAVKDFMLDDIRRMEYEMEFREKRPVIACAIDQVAEEMISLYGRYGGVSIINPFSREMDELLGVDDSKNTNRNRQHIRDLPKCVTLCNIKNRAIYTKGTGQAAILVSPEDYIFAVTTVGKPIMQMLSQGGTTREVYANYVWEKLGHRESEFKTHDEYENIGKIKEEKIDGWRKAGKITWEIEKEKEKAWKEAWEETVKTCPCITKKECQTDLNMGSPTTAFNGLEDLVEEGVLYKVQIGKPNYYFPTSEFKEYMGILNETLFAREELEKDSDRLREIYDENIERLEKLGFKK